MGVPLIFIFDIGLSLVVISLSGCCTDGDSVPGSRSHGPGLSVTSVPVWAFWKIEVLLSLLGIEPRFRSYTARSLYSTPIIRIQTNIY